MPPILAKIYQYANWSTVLSQMGYLKKPERIKKENA